MTTKLFLLAIFLLLYPNQVLSCDLTFTELKQDHSITIGNINLSQEYCHYIRPHLAEMISNANQSTYGLFQTQKSLYLELTKIHIQLQRLRVKEENHFQIQLLEE